jgi:PAS domain S-box-containing protein
MDKIAAISQQLLQFSPDALIVVDFQGTILFANATSRALFGYSREQLVGQSIDMLVPIQDPPRRTSRRFHARPHREGDGSAHH